MTIFERWRATWREQPRDEMLAPLLVGLALALPTVISRFPPMTDLPLHDAVVGMMRHLHDPAYFPQDLYHLNLGHPNQLFHVSAWALSFLFGVDGGCKAVIALSQLGIILGGARLARHLGRSQWTALLLSPLAIGWSFFWGLVANLVGFALLLYSLPTLDRRTERPSLSGAAVCSLWMLLLYFAHESVMVVACSAVLVFTFGQPLRWKETTLRLAPIVFALVVFFAQALVQVKMVGEAKAGAGSFEFRGLAANIHSVPTTLTGSLDPVSRTALFSLAVLGILVFASERWRAHGEPVPRQLAPFVFRYRFELIALGNAIAFFVMPFGFAGGTMFNHRFYHPAYALLALSIAPLRVRWKPSLLARIIAVTLPLGILFIDWPQFLEADRLGKELDVLTPQIAQGSSVMFLEADPPGGTRIFSSATSAARVLGQRGGRIDFSMTASNIAPVQFDDGLAWNEAMGRISMSSLDVRPDHDLRMFRYILLHSRDPNLAVLAFSALKPEARFVDMHGEWMLLESTLPRIALDAPEPPMPTPLPPSFRTRLRAVLKQAMDDGSIPLEDTEARAAATRSLGALSTDPSEEDAGAAIAAPAVSSPEP